MAGRHEEDVQRREEAVEASCIKSAGRGISIAAEEAHHIPRCGCSPAVVAGMLPGRCDVAPVMGVLGSDGGAALRCCH
jgi:hypothetical protein